MPIYDPTRRGSSRSRFSSTAVALAGLALMALPSQAASLSSDAKAVLGLKDAAGPRQASDPKFGAPDGFRLLLLGEKVPEERSFSNVTFDGEGMKRLFGAGIQVNPGSSLSLQNCRIVNAPRDHIIFSGISLNLDHCYIGKLGLLSQPGDHLEQIFVHGGNVKYSYDLFDMTGSPTPPKSITAVLFFKANGSDIDAVIDHCIITGISELQANYPIQVDSNTYDVKLTISNTGLQRGTSGYVGATQVKGRITIIDGGGNYDIDSGRPIKVGAERIGGR